MKTPWLVTIPRIVLGVIFASAAVSYFWMRAFGWPLLPVRISDQGLQFALSIIKIGYLWPLMKSINLVAGFLLIINRAPAFALALLAPITVVIVWFQIFLNPLPVPLVTVAVVILCEVMLLRAYAKSFGGMFANTSAVASTRTWG